jgi:uncharacterized protein Yka (UPF0111/DUF47 family)
VFETLGVKMGFIEKFIVPKEEDFVSALKEQTGITRKIVDDLYDACIKQNPAAFDSIRNDAGQMRTLRNTNMKRLFNVFLTPYDRESIYRLISQLDWVVLSVKHFVIEREVYGIESMQDYRPIFDVLKEMANLQEQSFDHLSEKRLTSLDDTIEQIHDRYDLVVENCARAMAKLFKNDDCKTILRHKDIVAQLKEIAKRMHVTANTIEDMALKLV